MKKLLTLAIAASLAPAMASAGWFVGVDLSTASNSFDNETTVLGQTTKTSYSNSSVGYKLNVGYENSTNWQYSIYYQKENFDKGIFDAKNKDANNYGLTVRKSFPLSSNRALAPYVQTSLGFGSIDAEGYNDSSASSVAWSLGGGIAYSVMPQMNVYAGLDYQMRRWSDVTTIAPLGSVKRSDDSWIWTLGAQYKF